MRTSACGPTWEEVAAALLALTDGEQQGSTSLSALPRPMLRGQDAADTLTARARALAARALKPDLAALRAALDGADPTPNHLRVAILQAFGQMDSQKLAALTTRALILADLAGRLAALEQV